MKKSIISMFLVTLSLFSGGVQYGKGSFEMSGGFMGMTQTLKTDITTYSLVEEHSNIFLSNWYYRYNFTWYDSTVLTNMYNMANDTLHMIPINIIHTDQIQQMIDYKMQGLDANIVLGNDILHQDENDYIGLGVMVGVSIPWIESSSSSNSDNSNSNDLLKIMKKSKTKILTYKIGPSVSIRKSLNKHFMIYGSATYAYQKGTFENKYAQFKFDADGIFQEYDVGMRFQLVSEDYDMGWITISPRLYGNIGYRLSSWELKDVNMDITGLKMDFMKTDFSMKSSTMYMGWGYSF
jgi:hypothetical protein